MTWNGIVAEIKSWVEFLMLLTVLSLIVVAFYDGYLDSVSKGAPVDMAAYQSERTDKLLFVFCRLYIFGIIANFFFSLWRPRAIVDTPKPEILEVIEPENMEPMNFTDTRESLKKDMENIVRQWVEYETDPVKMLDYPMLSMMSFTPTADFHRCLIDTRKSFQNNVSLDALHEAVVELEHRYRVMIAEARRAKWNDFTPAEQNHLRKAKNLLNIASNSGASIQERRVAYKRLMRELEGILVLAPVTVEEIESRVMLRIED